MRHLKPFKITETKIFDNYNDLIQHVEKYLDNVYVQRSSQWKKKLQEIVDVDGSFRGIGYSLNSLIEDVQKDKVNLENFLEDMGERPNGKSLDRIDNNKGYNKENCKWADEKEQKSNMSSNILVKHNNKTITMAEWSRITNINYETIKYYRRKKFSFEQIKDKFNLKFL